MTPRARRAPLAAAALAAACASPLASLRAQVPADAAASPSAFTLIPHAGMTVYGDLARMGVRDAGGDPALAFDARLRAQLDAQPTFGLSASFRPVASRWGAFGDFSRSSGDATLRTDVCFVDPDLGPTCAKESTGAEGSQWRLSAGVTRSFSPGSNSTAILSLGGVYGRTHFELDADEVGSTVGASESNPGVLVAGAVELPLSPRLGVQLQLSDVLMRVSGDAVRRALLQDAINVGVVVESDARLVNALGFGVGLVLRL